MKLSKDQINKLVAITLATVGVLFALCYLLIGAQNRNLKAIVGKIDAAREKQHRVEVAVMTAAKTEADLNAAHVAMSEIEMEMASGDLYSWMYNTIKDFKSSHRVEIPQFSGVDAPANCNLIYKFPFKQVKMSLNGSGYFHDIGKFVADFENHFPHMRIQNLELSPAAGNAADRDREKLAFRMEIVALVKAKEKKP